MSKLKVIDFFCGGGGMTYGLRQAGIDVIAGVDIDADAKETYEHNNPGSQFVLEDITQLKSDYFEKTFGTKKNDDALIFVGCSPCQYYSIIRTDKKKSIKTKDLLSEFQRFIDYYRPGCILVENVPGIVTNKDSILPNFLNFLTEKAYKYEKDIVNMKNYAIPQSRSRFSLIATRLDKKIFLPEKANKIVILRDVLGKENGFSVINAGHSDETEFFHSTSGLCELNLKRLKKTPKDGGTRLSWKNDPELQLECYKDKDNSFRDVYGRMFWDKPSSTITTKFLKTSNGRFAHPDEDRAISIREGATLQTFPKDYVFKTQNLTVAAKLIGNAVPPEYARRLGEVIIGELA